jgi:uncharacterized membrane-anchored protein YitT (DUF2179 family)
LAELRTTVRHYFREGMYISLGILSAAFGLEGFLLPGELLDGGVTGISLLVRVVSGVPLSISLVLINLPFVLIGWFQLGRGFAMRSILAIGVLAGVLTLVHFPVITDDGLLIAVFGGFFLGLGIGLVVRGGAVIDGTEVLAIYVAKRTGFSIGEVVFVFNVIIFAVAAYLLSMETALYSMLTYFVASKTVDYVLEGFEEYIGATIVSDHAHAIRSMILTKLRRGVTVFEGHKGYRMESQDPSNIHILLTIITRLEVVRLQTEVDKIDPQAFIVMHKIKDTKGGMIRHRLLKAAH